MYTLVANTAFCGKLPYSCVCHTSMWSPFDNDKKTVRSGGERSLPGGMTLHHNRQHKNAQSQPHLLRILLHYLSHQLQMLHEVEIFSPCDLQKHYIIKQKDYKESNRTGKTVSASSYAEHSVHDIFCYRASTRMCLNKP